MVLKEKVVFWIKRSWLGYFLGGDQFCLICLLTFLGGKDHFLGGRTLDPGLVLRTCGTSVEWKGT